MKFLSSLRRDLNLGGHLSTIFVSRVILTVIAMGVAEYGYCSPPECVTDDTGTKICLLKAPQRIISLAPNLTETVYGLGAQDLLFGRTARCNRPAEVEKVPEVGAYLNPDLERIMALRPDLVLATKPGLREEIVTRLSGVGIPVFVEDCKSLEDVCNLVVRLGVLLGRPQEAETVARDIQQRRVILQEHLRALQKPSALFAVGVKPLVVAGGNSFLGSILREAGGVNIAESSATPYTRFSFEEVLRRDPEYILVLDKECKKQECLDYLKRYSTLRAVKDGKVRSVDADLVSRPSPRAAEALEMIADVLHPGSAISASMQKQADSGY
ncbi:MAG: cobalamin transport system substrate-binding protein [Thermodesulfobacteriota bacterium]|nr:cobalamin transport system substrate-binding protein [Thermodesulfobacteriota bacterium]